MKNSNRKPYKNQGQRPDRIELHRRLQDLTYWERRNRNEFYIRFEELRRDMGCATAALQKIYDSHKWQFGVKES
jgi:hypothetical protein